MKKIILVTGGARSGKSNFAEETVKKLGDKVLYIATAIAFDDEMKLRIKKHQEQRPPFWETLEAFKDFEDNLKSRLEGKDVVMLDCVTVMITNLMYEKCLDWDKISVDEIDKVEEYIKTEIEKLLSVICKAQIPFVFVTNEIGMGIVPEYASARAFRDIAGRANQMLAKVADEVYFCVSGIPVKIK